eukprot:NODE_2529_length_681_cov_27.715190_g2071_i0.p1 GENE.NODE_2529_length_681_cov_27.715190_g2071_i0~~NODE_2529_length_681_cov_27.715190_g2071_i0.p1  ORF type:complete len:130 (-),score=23.36 NODE_2529_length_681_cov_27.715190_g2071_i0:57-446(-)
MHTLHPAHPYTQQRTPIHSPTIIHTTLGHKRTCTHTHTVLVLGCWYGGLLSAYQKQLGKVARGLATEGRGCDRKPPTQHTQPGKGGGGDCQGSKRRAVIWVKDGAVTITTHRHCLYNTPHAPTVVAPVN